MTKVLKYTSAASKDLVRHLAFIAEKSEVAAEGWLDRMERKCLLLKEFPELGQSLLRYGEAVRAIVVGRHIIFYRVLEDAVEVLRVLGGEQNTEEL
jgi:toxin ParE1/3/4